MAAVEHFMTAAELFQTPGLGRCELVRGELVPLAPAGFEHGRIAVRVGNLLSHFVEPRGLGVVLGAGTGFQIAENPDTVRAPDVAFIHRERIADELPDGYFHGAPDLAVEVISPDDLAGEVTAKVQDWLAAGCCMVWVVYPKNTTAIVYRSRDQIAILGSADSLDGSDVLPGFSVPVAGIFAM